MESSATISVRSHEGKAFALSLRIGKCLLASNLQLYSKVLSKGWSGNQATPTTITHPQRLYEELARIRRQGWL
ncbi:MAG: IclR family transcriptional regulator C-terminal domain-containing protein [Escherichia coli]